MPANIKLFCGSCGADGVLRERWFSCDSKEEVFPSGGTKFPGYSFWCTACEDFIETRSANQVAFSEDDFDRNGCPACGGRCVTACA